MAAAVSPDPVAEFSRFSPAAPDGGHWPVLPRASAQAACARAAVFHAGGGGIVFCVGPGPGGAGACAAGEPIAGRSRETTLRGHSRQLLVSFEGERVPLLLHVAALHAAALPL